jgi:hypothetical protein
MLLAGDMTSQFSDVDIVEESNDIIACAGTV